MSFVFNLFPGSPLKGLISWYISSKGSISVGLFNILLHARSLGRFHSSFWVGLGLFYWVKFQLIKGLSPFLGVYSGDHIFVLPKILAFPFGGGYFPLGKRVFFPGHCLGGGSYLWGASGFTHLVSQKISSLLGYKMGGYVLNPLKGV